MFSSASKRLERKLSFMESNFTELTKKTENKVPPINQSNPSVRIPGRSKRGGRGDKLVIPRTEEVAGELTHWVVRQSEAGQCTINKSVQVGLMN